MRALDLHPAIMNIELYSELSSLEETRRQFNGGKAYIKLGIDVHQARLIACTSVKRIALSYSPVEFCSDFVLTFSIRPLF